MKLLPLLRQCWLRLRSYNTSGLMKKVVKRSRLQNESFDQKRAKRFSASLTQGLDRSGENDEYDDKDGFEEALVKVLLMLISTWMDISLCRV